MEVKSVSGLIPGTGFPREKSTFSSISWLSAVKHYDFTNYSLFQIEHLQCLYLSADEHITVLGTFTLVLSGCAVSLLKSSHYKKFIYFFSQEGKLRMGDWMLIPK